MKNLLKKLMPSFVFSFYHFLWAFFSAFFYGFPSRKLKVIGVTGTDGKTSVVYLIAQMLENLGYRTAFFSSSLYGIDNQICLNKYERTTPGWYILQRFLKQSVKAGCDYAVIEVASGGIKQHRHRFIDFKTALLTNLTPEHIEESHGGSFEDYKKTKGRLFQAVGPEGCLIVNSDDKEAGYFLSFPAKEKWGYGLELKTRAQHLVKAESYSVSQEGVSFKVNGLDFNLPLLGKFNIYNALAAISLGLSEGIALNKIKDALKEAKPMAGRFEIVIKEPFKVIVDYALTPNALEKLYASIKEIFPGRVIGVLGAAGGGRDKWKRPQLGKIASRYLDKIILTSEDPYDENPGAIIDQIAKGADEEKIEKIADRRGAISRALEIAQKGDVVVVTGKGGDLYMHLAKGEKISWSDKEVIKEEFKKSHDF